MPWAKPKAKRKFTLSEWMTLLLLADDIEKTVCPPLAGLVWRLATGGHSVMGPMVDRMKQLGREELSERIKKLVK